VSGLDPAGAEDEHDDHDDKNRGQGDHDPDPGGGAGRLGEVDDSLGDGGRRSGLHHGAEGSDVGLAEHIAALHGLDLPGEGGVVAELLGEDEGGRIDGSGGDLSALGIPEHHLVAGGLGDSGPGEDEVLAWDVGGAVIGGGEGDAAIRADGDGEVPDLGPPGAVGLVGLGEAGADAPEVLDVAVEGALGDDDGGSTGVGRLVVGPGGLTADDAVAGGVGDDVGAGPCTVDGGGHPDLVLEGGIEGYLDVVLAGVAEAIPLEDDLDVDALAVVRGDGRALGDADEGRARIGEDVRELPESADVTVNKLGVARVPAGVDWSPQMAMLFGWATKLASVQSSS